MIKTSQSHTVGHRSVARVCETLQFRSLASLTERRTVDLDYITRRTEHELELYVSVWYFKRSDLGSKGGEARITVPQNTGPVVWTRHRDARSLVFYSNHYILLTRYCSQINTMCANNQLLKGTVYVKPYSLPAQLHGAHAPAHLYVRTGILHPIIQSLFKIHSTKIPSNLSFWHSFNPRYKKTGGGHFRNHCLKGFLIQDRHYFRK